MTKNDQVGEAFEVIMMLICFTLTGFVLYANAKSVTEYLFSSPTQTEQHSNDQTFHSNM